MKAVKQLEQKASEQQKAYHNDDIVRNVNQLLLESVKNDDKILESLGLDHQIRYTKNLELDINRTKHSQEIYDSSVFTGKSIKELCNKYDLKILPSRYYNGSIPPELTRKITEFCKKNENLLDKDGNPFIRQNSFYLLAPSEMFNTIKHVPVNEDPILLFKVDSDTGSSDMEAYESDKFIPVHYWGNDFTFLRKYKYLLSNYNHSENMIPNINKVIGLSVWFTIALLFTIFGHEFFKIGAMVTFTLLFVIYSIRFQYVKETYLDKLWNQRKR